MQLYFSPFACSLASHITAREAGLPLALEAVTLATKRTASGADFLDKKLAYVADQLGGKSFVVGARFTIADAYLTWALNLATLANPFFVTTTWIGAVRDNTDNWWRTWSCGLETTNCQ